MNHLKTKSGRGPAPPSGAPHDAKRTGCARREGPLSGSLSRVALGLAMVCLAACQAPVPTGAYRGPVSAEMPELNSGGGPGESESGGEEDMDEDGDDAADDATCEEGETRECRVILGVHEGVTSCFVGVEICRDGAWGTCGSAPLTM